VKRKARTIRQRSLLDKSNLALPEPRRLRDRENLPFVAKQPCLVCGRQPCDPHRGDLSNTCAQ
jgi:hypothetical protein